MGYGIRVVLVMNRKGVYTELADWALQLADDGHALVHDFDAAQGASKVPELLRRLAGLGIDFKDLQTEQSSLEDIFVSLVHR